MMTARQGWDHLWAYTLIGDMAGLREEIWKLLGPDSLPLPGVWHKALGVGALQPLRSAVPLLTKTNLASCLCSSRGENTEEEIDSLDTWQPSPLPLRLGLELCSRCAASFTTWQPSPFQRLTLTHERSNNNKKKVLTKQKYTNKQRSYWLGQKKKRIQLYVAVSVKIFTFNQISSK